MLDVVKQYASRGKGQAEVLSQASKGGADGHASLVPIADATKLLDALGRKAGQHGDA